jgi:dUTP pyrophosphatase
MNHVELMRSRILDIVDDNNPYTQEDFDKEFSSNFASVNLDENYKLDFDFVNVSDNPDPEYATSGSSGFDLRANLSTTPNGRTTIPSGAVALIPTGLFFKIPENFEIQVRPRSGLAAKNAVTVLNTPGTVDADYRGEVKVILINHGVEDFEILHGDRIAQAVIASVIGKNVINLNRVDEIDSNTERGAGGFGSTGRK